MRHDRTMLCEVPYHACPLLTLIQPIAAYKVRDTTGMLATGDSLARLTKCGTRHEVSRYLFLISGADIVQIVIMRSIRISSWLPAQQDVLYALELRPQSSKVAEAST